ncbi:molybdopterin-dependent oxidoreductase [Saccharopolyspora erythraea]|uniref:molybdopterin-dependent oxidoreductase n=1 Tax=Saccharopolyspora erythraea TaxID=1836 RepID=UPI001BA8AAB0|nr:molybdopterin-dependent oxidoreductase [Saccharopolyspora erythraea]QUH03173.1 molybdopterin-dependent oxidoreductase [Saccharopolyspora erythraea]
MTAPVPRSRAAFAGVAGAGSALAAGHLVAGLDGLPTSSPMVAVGNSAIDLAPTPVKEFAVRAFGTADKVVLLTGMSVVIAVLAVVAGLISRRSRWPGSVLIGAFGVLGMVAVAARPDFTAPALAAPVVSLIVGVVVFGLLIARGGQAVDGEPSQDRRRFLTTSAAVVAGAGVAGAAGTLLGQGGGTDTSRRLVGARIPGVAAPPPGADFAVSGTPSFLTPNPNFYRIDTALTVPQLRVEDWQLRLHGMVDRELVLSFDDLLRRPLVTRPITLACVSNEVGGPYISTAEFHGVRVRDLLLEAGVRPGAQQLFTTSADGFDTGTPLDVLLEPDRDALLAVGMNGEPLPAEHGFPVRMVVPGLYGYVSATKWLVDAEVTTFDRQHYWEKRGWAKQGPIKTQSRIDRPRNRDSLPAGPVTMAGIAWAQHTGIDRVEVRVDGGPWRTAELATDVSRDTWRMWRTTFHLKPGEHTVECRATDRAGHTQTEQRRPVIPDGATGWHSVTFSCAG